MTRILWLTPNTPTGISLGRRQLAAQLRSRGYSVDQEQAKPGHLTNLHHYDAVIGTTRRGALLGQFARFSNTPFVVDHVDPIRQFHETASPLLAKPVDAGERLAFRTADHVLYVYREAARRVPQSKATKTTLGVEFHNFAAPPEGTLDAASAILDERDIGRGYAVYIGGLEPIYNVQAMIDAVEYMDRDLIMMGEGSLRETVEQAAASVDGLHYLGNTVHEMVPAFVNLAGVGLSLVDDPHTCKVLEYGAAGLPVVHLRGRAQDILPDGITYTDADPELIATAVEFATASGELTEYAAKRDYATVADDYEVAIEAVIA